MAFVPLRLNHLQHIKNITTSSARQEPLPADSVEAHPNGLSVVRAYRSVYAYDNARDEYRLYDRPDEPEFQYLSVRKGLLIYDKADGLYRTRDDVIPFTTVILFEAQYVTPVHEFEPTCRRMAFTVLKSEHLYWLKGITTSLLSRDADLPMDTEMVPPGSITPVSTAYRFVYMFEDNSSKLRLYDGPQRPSREELIILNGVVVYIQARDMKTNIYNKVPFSTVVSLEAPCHPDNYIYPKHTQYYHDISTIYSVDVFESHFTYEVIRPVFNSPNLLGGPREDTPRRCGCHKKVDDEGQDRDKGTLLSLVSWIFGSLPQPTTRRVNGPRDFARFLPLEENRSCHCRG